MKGFKTKHISQDEELMEDSDEIGQLSLDVYQTESDIVVIAPIAGVTLQDIQVSITDEVLTIEGERRIQFDIDPANLFTQECYWGKFSRSIVLPTAVNKKKIQAKFKNGILEVTIPKTEEIKTKVIKIKPEDD